MRAELVDRARPRAQTRLRVNRPENSLREVNDGRRRGPVCGRRGKSITRVTPAGAARSRDPGRRVFPPVFPPVSH